MPGKSVIAKRKVCNMTPKVKERIDQLRNGIVPVGYKRTKAGICPEDWVENVLGDIYTERKEPGNESLPLLTVSIHSGVSDGEVCEKDLPKRVKRIENKSQYKRAVVGDLVFNMMRAWQGAIGSVRTEGMVSPAYVVAKPNDMVDPLFMDYYMKTNRMVHTIHRQSYGVTDFRLRLYWESFAPIPCVLPPAREQKKIAEILSTQDKVIELEQQKIEEIMKVKRFFLEKMFPKKGKTLPEIRFKGFTDPWEQRKLNELVIIERGGSPRPIDKFITNDANGLNWVKIGDAPQQGNYITKTAEKIIPEGLSKTREVHPGDLILSNSMSFGKPYIMAINGCIHDGWLLIRDTNKVFDLKFLCQMLGIEQMLSQYKALAAGSTVNNLNKELVGNTNVKIPNIKEQQQIGDYFANLDNLITLHQRELEKLQNIKKSMLEKMFV